MAYGDEQSMRILPSLSTVMKPKVGSTFGLTTSIFSPYRSAMGAQKATAAPPIGSTPILSPAPRIASRRSTSFSPATYGVI